MRLIDEITRYIKNYRSRHPDNIDMALHIIGVPEVLFGLFQVIMGKWKIGLLNIFLGYLWQWIGHTYFDRNEMGEVIGIKKLLGNMKKRNAK